MATLTDIKLSDDQSAAVKSDAPAILVTASAGSGKTEVVAQRVERLLSADPGGFSRVLALSYTVKASNELKDRFEARLGSAAERVDTDTVHGFAHRLLRQSGPWIGLPIEPEILTRVEDRVELLARWLEEQGRSQPRDPVGALAAIDLARARCDGAPPYLEDWRDALDSARALDYGAMLERATELVSRPTTRRQLGTLYHHVIVDEAQNLTPAQYRLLRCLLGEPPLSTTHAMFIGDDKQSIVGFSGGDHRLMTLFAEDYSAERHYLTTNYRSARAIVALGDRVAARLGHGESSSEVNYAAPGSIAVEALATEEDEGHYVAEWVSGLLTRGLPADIVVEGESTTVRADQIAVLGRSSAALRATERALESRGIATATAVALEDWLTSRAGQIVLELIAMHAADHRSTKWQMARMLDVDEADVESIDGLASILARSSDHQQRALSTLCTVDQPPDFVASLEKVEIDDPNWQADVLQIEDAWGMFTLRTDHAAQNWSNFRMFLTRMQRANDLADGVRCLTVHKSQGREYRAVAIVGMNDGQFPDFRAAAQAEREAELRAFYVAVTRPTRALLLTRARSRLTRYSARTTEPSPFLHFLHSDSTPT